MTGSSDRSEDPGGVIGPGVFRVGSGGDLPVVSVTRLPPELARRADARTLLGEPGFTPDRPEPPFAAGSVTGYRWWAITALDVTPPASVTCPRCGRTSHHPADVAHGYCGACHDWTSPPRAASGPYNPGPLRGMHAAWQPGENTAMCLDGTRTHGLGTVPDENCYCGFYAFWDPPAPYSVLSTPGLMPVFGVIEGYGKVVIGSKGFRCAKARVLALHLPDAGLAPDLHEAVNAALELVLPGIRVCRRYEDLMAEFPPYQH